jgi:hypothetical protein
MWKPNQLLNDDVVLTLRQAGFGETQIEYLGWLSGTASALNKSRNPAQAAHTILAGEKTKNMVVKFMARKKESVAPKKVADHDEVDRMFSKFERWAEQVEAEARPFAPSNQDREDHAGDSVQ